MLRRFTIQVACWLAVWTVGTSILVLSGAEPALRRMLAEPIATDTGWALSMLVAGILAFVCVLFWIALDLEDRIGRLIWPRPRLGSLPYQNIETSFVLEPQGANQLDIVVTLLNQEEELVRFAAQLDLVVNDNSYVVGALGEGAPANFVSGREPTSLLWTAHDVPIQKANDKVGHLNVMAKYTVEYAFARGWGRSRSRVTSKTVVFTAPVALDPETEHVRTKIHPRFFEQREE